MVYAPTPLTLSTIWNGQVEKFLANLQTYIALLSFVGGVALAANSFYTGLRTDINTLKLNQAELQGDLDDLKTTIDRNSAARDGDINEIQRDIKDILRQQQNDSNN